MEVGRSPREDERHKDALPIFPSHNVEAQAVGTLPHRDLARLPWWWGGGGGVVVVVGGGVVVVVVGGGVVVVVGWWWLGSGGWVVVVGFGG